MKRRAVFATVSMAIVVAGLGTAPARADQSPPGCSTNGLALDVTKSQTLARNGDTLTYTIKVSNSSPGSCDITGAIVDLVLPAADGMPTGTSVRVATGASYPAGFAATVIGTINYKVALNPGVTNAIVRATVDGVLHDAPTNNQAAVQKTLGTSVPPPHMTLTKVASTAGGPAPLPVTYTYTLVNDSLTDLPIGNVSVTDNLCSPLVFAGGDSDGDTLLDVGEKWTYTCVMTHPNPGTFVNTATATGTDVTNGQPVTAGPVTATVVVTAPPVVVAAVPTNCLAVPKSLSLRARELTTVRVQVNAADGKLKGAVVRISGPGFSRRGTTNSKGVVTFKVRPTKKGTLTISSDRCLEVERASVKAARQTQSRRVPRVTG
jgi:uncharacterized repeat protein (TIGR01451 family)